MRDSHTSLEPKNKKKKKKCYQNTGSNHVYTLSPFKKIKNKNPLNTATKKRTHRHLSRDLWEWYRRFQWEKDLERAMPDATSEAGIQKIRCQAGISGFWLPLIIRFCDSRDLSDHF